jgi:hypothetical protein
MPSPIAHLLSTSLTLKLLRANNAPLILGFLQDAFKERNKTSIDEETLELLLNEYLLQHDPDPASAPISPAAPSPAPPSAAAAPSLAASAPENRPRLYLNTWCSDDFRYLRKDFSEDRQCYVYQLTQYSEKALQWLRELLTGIRVGYTTTESRFSRIFSELETLSRQTKEDPKAHLKILLEQRDKLDAEIKTLRTTGKVRTLQPSQIRDRLLDISQMVEAFFADFRAVEDHFREQAREISSIYLDQNRSKGDIVEHALDTDDKLRNSEQGKSYYGFRALLGSPQHREQLTQYIDDAAYLSLSADTDTHLFRTLFSRLLEQSRLAQESFTRIAERLRRVVEESSTQNTRLILEQIADIKKIARDRRDLPSEDDFFEFDDGLAWANLMELGFYEKKDPTLLPPMSTDTAADNEAVLAAISRIGKPLDMAAYRQHVATLLADREQVSLRQLLETYPARDGAVDLVGYLCVASEKPQHLIDETEQETLDLNRPQQPRYATLNKIIFQHH